jgi:predicted negative regulator of RcsB-dependent stress response
MIALSMKQFAMMICAALMTTTLHAQTLVDRVQRHNGIDSGSITATTPLGITISKGGVTSKIPAEEIQSIQFAGEPPELHPARTQLARGRYDLALEKLIRIDRAKITRGEVTQDIDFYLAATHGNLALAGKEDIKQATADLGKFLSTHRGSYHVPEAIELQGDLYRAAGDIDSARKKYETLAKAPSPYYKARSALLVGQILQEQGEHANANAQFDAAIAAAGAESLAESIKREATLGRAISLAATGKQVAGTEIISQILQQAPDGDTTALAQGYNALGDALLAAGDKRGARDAYLHVDLLFHASPTEHAKSLFRLINLWKELRQPTRAQDAQQRLTDDYPLSRWAGR